MLVHTRFRTRNATTIYCIRMTTVASYTACRTNPNTHTHTQVVRWEDVVSDDLQERAVSSKGGGGPPTSPAQLRRRCYMAAAEGLGLGRAGKVIRECLLESGK